MNAELAAKRLGVTVAEVEAAHRYSLTRGLAVYRVRVDRRRRGAATVLQPR
jgi:hypothetical protein